MVRIQSMKNHAGWCALLLLSCLFGCNDDFGTDAVPEGERATISLQVDLSGMERLTRSDISSDLENRVNDLWIGVYNVNSGKRTGSTFITNDKTVDYPEPTTGSVKLDTQSGESYIVAVANCQNNTAINIKGANSEEEVNIKEHLDQADTWDKFRSLAVKQNFHDYAVVDAPTAGLPQGLVMHGSYRASGHSGTHSDDNPETVIIQPGNQTLSGRIHLRRLWTQNTINIQPDGNDIALELLDMELVNIPEYTWIQGREQGADASVNRVLEYANAGDAVSPELPSSPDERHPRYWNSLTITPASMDVTTTKETVDGKEITKTLYSYSFWQYENKRTGHIADATGDKAYAKRELEKKDDSNLDTGIYTALCPDGKLTLNNYATYLRFRANITYRNKPGDKIDGIDSDFSDVTNRTALVTYVVHLGYIGKDANDFNCYRNAQYTYNIKVKSVNNVIVEAFRNGENQPGAEGEVNDVTETYFNLDCHFNVFNIYFTKEQLDKFNFLIRTYENNVPYEIKYFGKGNSNNINEPHDTDDKHTDPNWKYYGWVQFVRNDNITATSDLSTAALAAFPKPADYNGRLYYLKDLADQKSALTNGKSGQGFTVYVKEYTYEAEYGDTGYGKEEGNKWVGYVNQPNRIAQFNVDLQESSDKGCIYYKSKYALSQESIQTYYNLSGIGSDEKVTGLGIEHDNEVFGMNLRWPSDVTGLDSDNGRYNVYLGYGGKSGVEWKTVVDLTSLQNINAINNTKQTALAYQVPTSARTTSVPKTVQIASSSLNGSSGKYNGPGDKDFDPQNGSSAQYIHALSACMNRNKDENGNGIIDNEELKWYVPATGKYLRVIIGRNSLRTPLMNYDQLTLPAGCGSDANTLYHFASSDNKIVWVDEGASSSTFYGGGDWSHAPWQVRCIRNLGTNLTTVTKGEKVTPAYLTEHDSTTYGGVVKVHRYYGASLREPQTAPLPMHKSSDAYNRMARYGFEIAPRGNNFSSNSAEEVPKLNQTNVTPSNTGTSYTSYSNAINNNTFCQKLVTETGRTGWRVPNQKEIIIIMRMGLLSGSLYATCTQEHWANFGTPGSSSLPLSWNYRMVTVNASDKIATAPVNTLNGLRCVRDLTAKEAGMSYSAIISQKSAAKPRRQPVRRKSNAGR